MSVFISIELEFIEQYWYFVCTCILKSILSLFENNYRQTDRCYLSHMFIICARDYNCSVCFVCFVFIYRRYNIYFVGDFVLWKSTGCRDIEVCEAACDRVLMQIIFICLLILTWGAVITLSVRLLGCYDSRCVGSRVRISELFSLWAILCENLFEACSNRLYEISRSSYELWRSRWWM